MTTPTNPYLDAAEAASFGRPDAARLEQLAGAALRAYITGCVEAATALPPDSPRPSRTRPRSRSWRSWRR